VKSAKGRPTSIYLEDDVRDFLDKVAASRNTSRSEVLNAILGRAAEKDGVRAVPEQLFCPRCTRELEAAKEIFETIGKGRSRGSFRPARRTAMVCQRCEIKVVIQRLPARMIPQ
jgi:hypothetical protein